MTLQKPSLSFWQIINMNVGFFGIQYSFGLQQTAINPLYTFLHAKPEELPLLNLAGPMTGLIIQPIIGAMSDRTWHPRWGRRKPYFLVGAIMCSLALFAFPFSKALWMAVGLLWILDAGNNTAMEPYRAFIADKLPPAQRAQGFLTQSFFTGLGITLANLSLFAFQKLINGHTTTSDGQEGIPYWVFGSFFVGAVCSIGSVLWSTSTTPEIPPTPEELEKLRAHKGDEEAVGWTGLVNGFYNIVTFLSAFALVGMAKRFSAKRVHVACLLMAAVALFLVPQIGNKYLLFLPMVGFGIAWASMMGVPYIMVVSSVPKERYGVYMGIVNMMIVIPMILQTLSFGWIYEHLLGQRPGNALVFAGVLLLLAALAMLRIREPKVAEDLELAPAGGH